MNERFEHLMKRAEEETFKFGSRPGVTIAVDTLEKFAELIVRECIDIASEQAENTKQHIRSPGDRHENRVHGVLDVRSAIKEHFGVE